MCRVRVFVFFLSFPCLILDSRLVSAVNTLPHESPSANLAPLSLKPAAAPVRGGGSIARRTHCSACVLVCVLLLLLFLFCVLCELLATPTPSPFTLVFHSAPHLLLFPRFCVLFCCCCALARLYARGVAADVLDFGLTRVFPLPVYATHPLRPVFPRLVS